MAQPLAQSLLPAVAERSKSACAHCGSPVPSGRQRTDGEDRFCCEGCRFVSSVIESAGLGHYYELKARLDQPGLPASHHDKSYVEFDDPTFAGSHCRDHDDGTRSAELYVQGVHCAACVWLIEQLPQVCDGVLSASLDYERSIVSVRWDPARVRTSQIAKALAKLGYAPVSAQVADSQRWRLESRELITRLGVAGAVACNEMLLSFALYSGAFAGMSAEYTALFRWASLAVAIPAVVYSAQGFFRAAFGALRAGVPHMDQPISLGILAGFTWGLYNTVRGVGEVYFDTTTLLIFLLLVGRFLQRRQQLRAAAATSLAHALTPATARLVEDGSVREVAAASILEGQKVEVRPGDPFPIDGRVAQGTTSIDQAVLTGESRPCSVREGDRVYAGTLNLSRRVIVETLNSGERTRVSRLAQAVESAKKDRPPVLLAADRLSRWFVVAVFALAAATLALHAKSGFEAALDHAIAVLIVTCPCALALATPLTVTAALGNAARASLLVKGGRALQALAEPGLIVFDKTGTLTEGKLSLVKWQGDEAMKPFILGAESDSSHPVAEAFRRAWPESASPPSAAVETLGGGISAVVGGCSVTVGSAAYVEARTDVPRELVAQAQAFAERGMSPILAVVAGVGSALCCFDDPIRSDAKKTLQKLRRLGYSTAILSGDDKAVVERVARELGGRFEFALGGVGPEDKLAKVRELSRQHHLIMVGDGVNDAGALAAASTSIAVHGGAEASLQAADAYVSRSGIMPVLSLISGARKTLRTIRRGLSLSLGYNVIGASLAVAGLIHPLVAAVLMPLSSLTVVLNAYKQKSFNPQVGSEQVTGEP